MQGVEIDFVVADSLAALALYERVFDLKRVEVTALARGENEAVFTLYGTRFHMLDENPAFSLHAPAPGARQSIWFNVMVPDLQATYGRAMDAGCICVQPITELPDCGVSNALFSDPFGYLWMLHQLRRQTSLEERLQAWEAQKQRP